MKPRESVFRAAVFIGSLALAGCMFGEVREVDATDVRLRLQQGQSGLQLQPGPNVRPANVEYPNPTRLVTMDVTVDANGNMDVRCTGPSGQTVCVDPPFYAQRSHNPDGSTEVKVYDRYGNHVGECRGHKGGGSNSGNPPVPTPPSGEKLPDRCKDNAGCIPDHGGQLPACPSKADEDRVKARLCELINQTLATRTPYRIDCAQVPDNTFDPTQSRTNVAPLSSTAWGSPAPDTGGASSGTDGGTQPKPLPPEDDPTKPAPPFQTCYGEIVSPAIEVVLGEQGDRVDACVADGQVQPGLRTKVYQWGMWIRQKLNDDRICYSSPLVLDLDNDGIELTSAESGVSFDLLAQGSPVRTAWTQGDDAFLCLDLNGNGRIDSGAELFGSRSGGKDHADGFLALALYDGNRDGRIDRTDRVFNRLRLWTDANHDGKSSAKELRPLGALDIVALDLAPDRIEGEAALDAHGNALSLVSHFVKKSGEKGLLVDAWLRYLPQAPRSVAKR